MKERKKTAQLQMAIDVSQRPLEYPGNERDLVAELAELRKCFDKSELVRKQQKLLIGKMKD